MRKKRKHGRAKNILTQLILILCVIVFFCSIWKLIDYLTEYNRGEQAYSQLSEHVEVFEPTKNKDGEKKVKPPVLAWDELKEINEDLIGYIYIDNTAVQYPIVQGTDNEYYLSHMFDKKKNPCGAIFMDASAQSDFSSENTLIYGHNMKTGKMFGSLSFYKDQDYLEEHPDIWIVTENRKMKYKIFSVYETTDTSDVYTMEFASDEEKKEYVKTCKEASIYDTGIKATKKNQILTLSTCTSVTEEGRFVVQAKLVYDKEITNEQE